MKFEKNNIIEKIFFNDTKGINQLKKKVYSGKIVYLNSFDKTFVLKQSIEKMFSKFFNISLFHYLAGNTVNFEEKKIINFQNLIKNSSVIKDIFKQFIKDLNFDLEDTFCDKITIRFSPSQNEKPLGLLKPAMPHRDTWASGFQHQINWWIPLHDVSRENSLYFLPKYFSKEVKNNSDKWNFESFKKNKKIMSTPVSTQKFFSNDYLYSQIRTGELLVFSGNHLHGSNLGIKRRVNIETRTLSSNDLYNYKIPQNIDNKNLVIKKKWFKSLKNSHFYED